MKKLLFCAGVLALAASCTEELDTMSSIQQQGVAQGITFTATTNEVATRGEILDTEEGYAPFWSADPGTNGEDKIKIFSTLTNKNSGATWNSVDAGATYKATKSQRRGEFTGINETNILNFDASVDETNPAQFLAVFPSTLTVGLVPNNPNVTANISVLPSLGTQQQTNTKGAGVFSNNVMWSATTGYPTTGAYGESKNGVGENLNLAFNYVYAGIAFRTENVKNDDVDYTPYFGKLEYVELKSDGEYNAEGEKVTTGKAAVNFVPGTDASLTLAVTSDETRALTVKPTFKMGTASAAASAKVELGTDGLDWSDEARAYMFVAPVEREYTEGFIATYKFENITFTETITGSMNWNAGRIVKFPALDINSYDYLVTTDGTLIINRGTIAATMTSGNNPRIKWPIGRPDTQTSEDVAVSSIKNVIINNVVSEADFANLAKFTALETLEMTEQTTIYANALAARAANITKLVLPKVTVIEDGFVTATGATAGTALSALKELDLQSYQFPSTPINYLLFNGMESASNNTLEKVNMKAVTDMTAEFDMNRTIAFEGFEKLTNVVLNENKVIVSQKAFKGCTNLISVSGKLDLEAANAVEAFMNAGSAVTFVPTDLSQTFSTVNITSTDIPARAFYNAKNMVNILLGGKQVVPTYVGTQAFQQAEQLVSMDLSQAAEIGENAFAGATNYVGVSGQTRLDVAAAEIESGILAGTKVVNVYFTNATKVNGPIFYTDLNGNDAGGERYADALTQVEFAKVFTPATLSAGGWDNAFGKKANEVDLFIQSGQSGYDRDNANVLSLPEIQGSGMTATQITNDITFKSIKTR